MPDGGSDLLREIAECLRRDDWDTAQERIGHLLRTTCPATPASLQKHLNDLQKVLLVARATRADLATSLARVRAAARFGHFQTVP